MDVRTRYVKERRFWRASGGHLAIIIVALQLPFFGNGFRSKPRGELELESLRQFVVVLNLILATPSTSLVPNCNGPAVSLDPSPTWRGGGGDAAWAIACPPHNTAQARIHSITYTYFHTWRGHSSFAIRVDTTRGATDTGYKPSIDWCRAWRQGLLPTAGEVLGSHRTAIARLKLGSPQPVYCCPAAVSHPHWVHGDKGPPEKQTATMAPGNQKRNVRTMITGLSASLQDIKDSRKTAVINDELRRLNVDIAILRETRLADSGTLREKDYTFFWQGKRSDEPREHGVGLAVRNSSGGSELLVTLRLNSATGPVSLISVCAPTLSATPDTKDMFYENLAAIIRNIPSKEQVVLLGNFNARVGADHDSLPSYLGQFG